MAFLSGILSVLTPFALSLLLAHALHRAINAAVVPKSFVRRQFIYAFLLLPFIDIFARIWLLQPFVPILAVLAVGVTGGTAATVWVLRKLLLMANQTVIVTSTFDQVANYARDELNFPELERKWQNLSSSIETLFSNLNYTQLYEDYLDSFGKYQTIANETNVNAGFQYMDLLGNFSHSPVLMEARHNLSSIINNSLHSFQFTDFVRNGDSYKNETLIFDDLKGNLILLFNRLSFENASSVEPFVDKIIVLERTWFDVEDKINALRLSLGSRAPEIVSSSTLSEEAKRTLDEILKVAAGQHSLGDALRSLFLTPASETKEMYQMCDAYDFLRIDTRWVVAILALVVMTIPLMYIGRTLLQSLIQWHLSKTYRDARNEAEREIDGYILAGGVTGIGFGAAQATVQALLWGFLPFSLQTKLALLVHCAMLMVIHCVTQMGINSAEGRRDLVRNWNGRKGWWILTTIVHLVTGIWWTAQYVGTLLSGALRVDIILGFLLVGDAVVLALFAWWGKNICHRARTDVTSRSRSE